MSRLRFRNPRLWALTLLLIVLDRVTKALILSSTALPKVVIPGFLSLVHVTNTGIAFGVFSNLSPGIMNPLLVTVGIGVTLVILYVLMTADEPLPVRIALHLLVAGAVGNVTDRLLWGEVVDFIDVALGRYHWPSFNVADASISVGLVIVIIATFFAPRARVSETD